MLSKLASDLKKNDRIHFGGTIYRVLEPRPGNKGRNGEKDTRKFQLESPVNNVIQLEVEEDHAFEVQ